MIFQHKFGPDLSSDDEIWADQIPAGTQQELREARERETVTITRNEYENLKRQIAELSAKEIK